MRHTAIVCIAALYCGWAVAADAGTAAKLKQQMIDALRDPTSAQTKDEFLSLSDSETAPVTSLCGMVNARNAYGGMVGFARFISTSDGQVIFESTERGAFGNMWPVWCTRPMAPTADAPPPSLCSAELVARLKQAKVTDAQIKKACRQ